MSRGSVRSFVRSALVGVGIVLVSASRAMAQSPAAEPQPGICAPWHRCLAYGGVAITVLLLAALALGYLVQRRGFETMEHRMGQPQGTKVSKE